jgi:hypothetical protein
MTYKRRGYLTGVLRQIPLLFIIFYGCPELSCQDTLPQVKVSVSSGNSTVNQILDEIALQTGYDFTYDASLIPGKEKIPYQVTDLLLEAALDSLLGDARFAYRLIQRNIVIYRKNIAPPAPVIEEIDRSILKGRVIDGRTEKPLPYTTLALFGTNMGTITNQNGEFSFKIPGDIRDPLLVVSYMGYSSKFIPVTYPIRDDILIRIDAKTISLQEVVIRYVDPEALVTEALQRIRENYLDDHSTVTAYYRESVKRNEHFLMFSEAILDVAKSPYWQSSATDHVRIRKSRKITDVTAEDTVMVKLRSGISSSLSLDVIKNPPDFLAPDLVERYDLKFTDMMIYADRLVYVISFRQKSHIPDLLYRGRLYVDQESLAIVAADFEFNPIKIRKKPGLFLVKRSPRITIRPMLARYHVDYKEVNGRYHISQARGEVEIKVRRRRKWIGARYRITMEVAITDVIPDQRLRISPSERVRPGHALSDEPFRFDPLFWGEHNTIEPEVSLTEALSRIVQNLQEIGQ